MAPVSEPLPHLPPLAELVALSPKAYGAIGDVATPIRYLPFRVGCQRRSPVGGAARNRERRGAVAPTNDLYLLPAPSDEVTYVAPKHFHIDCVGCTFVLVDFGSPLGTMVNRQHVVGGQTELNDGDTIKIGGPESPYVYRLRIL